MAREVIGKIDHIYTYPLKGAAAIETKSARVTQQGLDDDRKLMVVRAEPDENGIFNFVTPRERRSKSDKPQGLAIMALIKPQLIDNTLVLTWKGEDGIEVPADFTHGEEKRVRVGDDVVNAVDQGNKLAEWVSDHLDLKTRVVKAAGSFHRPVTQKYAPNDNTIRFQDAYPLHWVLQESVDELSQIADYLISAKTFKPNIVAVGSPAQTEHIIAAGEIAGIPFTQPKPCDRCAVTNIDPETAEIKVGRALTPLATYKRWLNKDGAMKVILGENMLPQGEGEINVGDEIVMTERRAIPLVYGATVKPTR